MMLFLMRFQKDFHICEGVSNDHFLHGHGWILGYLEAGDA